MILIAGLFLFQIIQNTAPVPNGPSLGNVIVFYYLIFPITLKIRHKHKFYVLFFRYPHLDFLLKEFPSNK